MRKVVANVSRFCKKKVYDDCSVNMNTTLTNYSMSISILIMYISFLNSSSKRWNVYLLQNNMFGTFPQSGKILSLLLKWFLNFC